MRREREAAEEEAKKELALNRLRRQMVGGGSDSEESDADVAVAQSPSSSAARHGEGSMAVEALPKRESPPGPMIGGGAARAAAPPATTVPAGRGRRMSAFESAGKFTNSHAKPGGGSAILNGSGLGSMVANHQQKPIEDVGVRTKDGYNRSQEMSQSGGFTGNGDDEFTALNKRTTGRVSKLTEATNTVKKKIEENNRHKQAPAAPASLALPRSPSNAMEKGSSSIGGSGALYAQVPNVRDVGESVTPEREADGLNRPDHSDSQCTVGSLEGQMTRIERVGSFMKSMFRASMDAGLGEGQVAVSRKQTDSFFRLPSMRADSVIAKEVIESTVVAFNTYEQLFDATETHHVLPVFAAGQAFVPSCFETLLVQSFYIVLTPIICEKLVSGQLSQTVVQVPIPPALLTRKYFDVFRLFMAQRVLCIGLYRAPQKSFGALLPYVYLAPPVSLFHFS